MKQIYIYTEEENIFNKIFIILLTLFYFNNFEIFIVVLVFLSASLVFFTREIFGIF